MAHNRIANSLRQYVQDRASWRSWILAAQDGIIVTAGILLGFAGAGAGDATLIIAATAATVAGMLSTGGANWSEAAFEREAQLAALETERMDIEEWRGEARCEIVDYYEQKGLDRDLAVKVVDQLMVRSPLKAALECEHGILELKSLAEVYFTGIGTALAYALGAAIPFALTFLLPIRIEGWPIVFAVLGSLTLTSIIGAHAGQMSLLKTIRRTVVVGVITISVSYLVGEVAF